MSEVGSATTTVDVDTREYSIAYDLQRIPKVDDVTWGTTDLPPSDIIPSLMDAIVTSGDSTLYRGDVVTINVDPLNTIAYSEDTLTGVYSFNKLRVDGTVVNGAVTDIDSGVYSQQSLVIGGAGTDGPIEYVGVLFKQHGCYNGDFDTNSCNQQSGRCINNDYACNQQPGTCVTSDTLQCHTREDATTRQDNTLCSSGDCSVECNMQTVCDNGDTRSIVVTCVLQHLDCSPGDEAFPYSCNCDDCGEQCTQVEVIDGCVCEETSEYVACNVGGDTMYDWVWYCSPDYYDGEYCTSAADGWCESFWEEVPCGDCDTLYSTCSGGDQDVFTPCGENCGTSDLTFTCDITYCITELSIPYCGDCTPGEAPPCSNSDYICNQNYIESGSCEVLCSDGDFMECVLQGEPDWDTCPEDKIPCDEVDKPAEDQWLCSVDIGGPCLSSDFNKACDDIP